MVSSKPRFKFKPHIVAFKKDKESDAFTTLHRMVGPSKVQIFLYRFKVFWFDFNLYILIGLHYRHTIILNVVRLKAEIVIKKLYLFINI